MNTAIYLRVSTTDQEKGLSSQRDAIKTYCKNHKLKVKKCHRFTDKSTGGDDNRPGLKALQQTIFNGEIDCVVIWKLDRISRSLKDGVVTLCDWLEKDIKVISVAQQLDFDGPGGKAMMALLFALADTEATNIRENTKRGLVKARKRLAKQGRNLGRPPKFKKYDLTKILKLREEGVSVMDISKEYRVSKQTIYTALKDAA